MFAFPGLTKVLQAAEAVWAPLAPGPEQINPNTCPRGGGVKLDAHCGSPNVQGASSTAPIALHSGPLHTANADIEPPKFCQVIGPIAATHEIPFQVCPAEQKHPAGVAGTAVTVVVAPPVQVRGGTHKLPFHVSPAGQKHPIGDAGIAVTVVVAPPKQTTGGPATAPSTG